MVMVQKKPFPWVRLIIVIITVSLFSIGTALWILNIVNIIQGYWSTIIPALFTVFAVILVFLQFAVPLPPSQKTITAPYSERMKGLNESLTKASAEVDHVLGEMKRVIQERADAITALEQQEAELQKKVENMKEVPLPAAEFITKYLEIQEKKSSKRDYKIFIFGVIAMPSRKLCSDAA